MYLLVGNWCPGSGEKGFSVYEYSGAKGELKFLKHGCGDIAASFLTKGACDPFIYAANETDLLLDGKPANQIVVLDATKMPDEIEPVTRKPSYGANPTWICSAFEENYLLISHHGGFGNTSTIEFDADGTIYEKIIYDKPHVILYKLDENGIPERPVDAYLPCRLDDDPGQISRSCSVEKAPHKNFYIICDKGLDMVITVTVDFSSEKIVPLDSISVPKHYAPRYGVFHNRLPIFYADMEGIVHIYAFSYDELGNLRIFQVLDLSAEAGLDGGMPSDIILNPDGNTIYVGIRESNRIAVIHLDQDGSMKLQQLCSNKDGAPNALKLSPDGRYLFVTNVFEKVITRFAVLENGSLEYQGIAASDLCPASMLFFSKE